MNLVERVARAIRSTMWDSNEAARAAIREVAAWLDDEAKHTDGCLYFAAHLRKQLEETK